jgi:predicted alpha-1,2-mannosidase
MNKAGSSFYIGLIILVSCSQKEPDQADFSQFVNPFIGTTFGGNTFPGATTPWGMVSVSPHTDEPGPSGFLYEKPHITGFGHVHLSGTGCADLGSIVFMPTKGKLSLDPKIYQSSYKDQQARAGYYKTLLTNYGLLVETTAAPRSGVLKVTNTGIKDTVRVILDAGRSLSWVKAGSVGKVSSSEIKGSNRAGGFCGFKFTTDVYFHTKASRVPIHTYLWQGESIDKAITALQSDSLPLGAVFEYVLEQNEFVTFHTGISYTGTEQAKRNLETDQPELSFEKVLKAATTSWNKELGKIEIETDREEYRTNFYTALYHTLLQPALYSDADGSYKAFEADSILQSSSPRYTVFSLWDTYRTVHPLYTVAYPQRQKEMVETLVGMYRESGWLPKWELGGKETFVMVGDPAAIVVADSWMKGIEPANQEEAYAAIQKTSLALGVNGKPSNPIRSGWAAYNEYGFIPNDEYSEWIWGSVASSLEYAVADFGASQIAARLGKDDEQKEFLKKSYVFKEYFDSTTFFLRPKNKSGQWYEPFHPDTINTKGGWPGSGGPGYVEGNAWHYSWFVPHAIPELIKLYPSTDAFVKHLDKCFETGNFILWNEPDMNYPYIYNYLEGHEHKTSEIVFSNLRKHFKNEPSGLPGNDDCGTISGWYVFASLGFYPFCPGVPEYALNVPSFKKAVIYLDEKDPSKKWVIENLVKDFSNLKTVKVTVNGTPLAKMWIDHATVRNGGTITYYQ